MKSLNLLKQHQLSKLKNLKLKISKKDITIGIAQDKAFSFYYPASLAQLENLGAKVEIFLVH